MKIKRDLYEQHGVREYWLVHPTDKTVMVYCLSQDKQYAKAEIYASQDIVESTVIEGLKIELTDLQQFPPITLQIFLYHIWRKFECFYNILW
jgi:Uma2 family endonuclease